MSAPAARLKPLFALLGDIIKAADMALASTPIVDQQLTTFDAAMFTRGINAMKSLRIQLEQAKWETAVGASRQLFELLVNMEYLGSYLTDVTRP